MNTVFPLSSVFRHYAALSAVALLCALPASAQAAASTATAIHTLKTQLVRLRTFTVNNISPSVPIAGADNGLLHDAAGRMFKPLRAEAYADALQQLAAQPMGVRLTARTQLHCDFNRYRTADGQREIGLKVGIHVGFR